MVQNQSSNISASSSSREPFGLVSEDFQRWQFSQSNLVQAVEEYLEACFTLESTYAISVPQGLSTQFTETVASKVNLGIFWLTSHQEKLNRAHSALAKIRNRSRSLSPIHILPTEIMLAIFSVAENDCVESCFSPARSFYEPRTPAWAKVCASWRKIYLRWHPTASHIDLVVCGGIQNAYYQYAEHMVAITQEASLHLVIRVWVDRSEGACAATQDEIDRLLHFILPLMSRVYALDLSFKFKSPLLLNSVVSCWVKYGFGVLPKILKVWNSAKTEPVWLGDFSEVPSDYIVSRHELQNFFSPLKTLAMHNCDTSSETGLCSNLRQLRLEELHRDPTVLDMRYMFSRSPNLHTLTVEDVNIALNKGTGEPVWLNSLQNLGLGQIKAVDCLKRFMPLLNTTSSINVVLRMMLQPNFTSEVLDFFRRSSVKRLFIFGLGGYQYNLITSTCPASNLQELVIRDCDFEGASWEDPSRLDSDEPNTITWPLLHTLYLIRCTIGQESLTRLLELYPIRKLRIFSGYARAGDPKKRTFKECAELEEYLTEKNIDVEVLVNEAGCPTRSNFFSGMYA